MEKYEIRKINLEERTGHEFRYNIEGFALVQLYLGGLHENFISMSHIGSDSEARARKWGYIGGVNWENHKKEFNMLCNFIRRDSKIKAGSRIVMQEAYSHTRNDYILKDFKQATWYYKLNQDNSFELIKKSFNGC